MNYSKPPFQFQETLEVSGRLIRIPQGFREELREAHWAYREWKVFRGTWIQVNPRTRTVTIRVPNQEPLVLTDAGDIAFLFLEQ